MDKEGSTAHIAVADKLREIARYVFQAERMRCVWLTRSPAGPGEGQGCALTALRRCLIIPCYPCYFLFDSVALHGDWEDQSTKEGLLGLTSSHFLDALPTEQPDYGGGWWRWGAGCQGRVLWGWGWVGFGGLRFSPQWLRVTPA